MLSLSLPPLVLFSFAFRSLLRGYLRLISMIQAMAWPGNVVSNERGTLIWT